MDIHTQNIQQVEQPTQQEAHVDLTHTNRLSGRERAITEVETRAFVQYLKQRYVRDAYLHMDIERLKESKAGVDAIEWKALLVTNKGRISAKQKGYGVFNSLHKTFEAIELQLKKML